MKADFQKWLEWTAPSLKASSGPEAYRTACSAFFEWAEPRGLTLRRLSQADVTEFMQHALRVKGWKGSTLRNRLAVLRGFFTWAVREKLMRQNPINFKELPRVHVQEPEKVPFTEEQFRRVLKVIATTEGLCSWWSEACSIAWHTGLRVSDVAGLKWSEVSFDDNVISRQPIKTQRLGKRVEIPIEPELYTVLLGLKNRPNQGETVLPEMTEAYRTRRERIVTEFREICDTAGLPRHSFHSFRHGFVSRLINSGVDAVVISSMTGQTLEVIQGYAHVSRDAQRAALAKARGTVESPAQLVKIV